MSETETENTETTAGELLQKLRKEKELSVQDISEKIHLEPRVIEALEANTSIFYRQQHTPEATYAAMRNCLALMRKKLSGSIITMHRKHRRIIPEVKHPTQTSSTDRPVKAFSYLVTLVLVTISHCLVAK